LRGNLSFQLTHTGESSARLGDAAARVVRSARMRIARKTYGSNVAPAMRGVE
jgi:hypothetical protein